jgi:hypothetical protein
MAKSDKSSGSKKGRFGAEAMIIVFALGSLWFLIREYESVFDSLGEVLQPYLWIGVSLIGVLVVGIVLLWCNRLIHYFWRMDRMVTVRVELSRDDLAEPFEVMKFFDSVNGALLGPFEWMGFFTGHNHLCWEMGKRNGQYYIELSAPEEDVESIQNSMQSVYQNVKFSRVDGEEAVSRCFPDSALQMRLLKHWFYPLQTLKNYQKSITESILTQMDSVSEDEQIGFQVVMVPLSVRKQAKLEKLQQKFERKHSRKSAEDPADPGMGKIEQKELNASIEGRGKGFFMCEVRMFATGKVQLDGLIGVLREASQENQLIPERYISYLIRLLFKKQWWNWFVKRRMPAILLGPKFRISSFNLATILHLPTARLRVSGLKRSLSRRVPVPVGVPNSKEEGFLIASNGQYVSVPDKMRYQNMLIIGLHGSGKTTALRSYGAPVLKRMDQASVIVLHDKGDARQFLAYVPPEKKVYIIDVAKPGEYGLNILADDHIRADTLAGNLLSTFRVAFGDEAVQAQSGDLLQQSFLALRTVRDLHPRWKEAIPRIDFRHMRDMIAKPDFREKVANDLPPDTSIYDYWHSQFKLMEKSQNVYVNKVLPILNKYNALLHGRLEKVLCHPNPITLHQAIREEKAVVVLYTAKHEIGQANAYLFANMLMSLLFQAISSQADILEEQRVKVNLFLDEVQGYANDALLQMLQESRKYGARTAAATLSLSSIPSRLEGPFKQLFGHKVVFRNPDMEEADKWQKNFAPLYSNYISFRDDDQDRVRVGADDILNLKRYHCAVKIDVTGEPLETFMAQTIANDDRAHQEWIEDHGWPEEKKDLKILPVRAPELSSKETKAKKTKDVKEEPPSKVADRPNENSSVDKVEDKAPAPIVEKKIYPSIAGVSAAKVQKIVEELKLEYDQAKRWLDEAAEEIQNRKMKRGIVVFLEEFLRQKKEKTLSEGKDQKLLNLQTAPEQEERPGCAADDWPSVGGLKPEKVAEIVSEFGFSLEECYEKLVLADKEIEDKKANGVKITSRPQIIRNYLQMK